MLKLNLLVVLASLALTILLLSIPNTAAYEKLPYQKIELTEFNPPEILQVQLATTTEQAPDHFRTQAILVKKAIASLESKGADDCEHTPGQSGEKGCFQYLPSTWASYSLEIYGYVAEQTVDHAEYVTEEKIYRWLKAGYSPRDIFLIWNQGNAGPCKSGYNSHNVYFDSCGYADRGMAQLSALSK